MDESKIGFGDKMFLYGQYLTYLEEFGEYEYNAAMGYMTIGGYYVYPTKTDVIGASLPGFVAEILYDGSLAPTTPFDQGELIDITEDLALSRPTTAGTRVWMPTALGTRMTTTFSL